MVSDGAIGLLYTVLPLEVALPEKEGDQKQAAQDEEGRDIWVNTMSYVSQLHTFGRDVKAYKVLSTVGL